MDNSDIERKKLEQEIRTHKFERWFNVAKIFISAIAVIGTLIFAYVNGVFDTRKATLDYQVENLKYDINQFESRRAVLENLVKIDSIKLDSISTLYIEVKNAFENNKKLSHEKEAKLTSKYETTRADLQSKLMATEGQRDSARKVVSAQEELIILYIPHLDKDNPPSKFQTQAINTKIHQLKNW